VDKKDNLDVGKDLHRIQSGVTVCVLYVESSHNNGK